MHAALFEICVNALSTFFYVEYTARDIFHVT